MFEAIFDADRWGLTKWVISKYASSSAKGSTISVYCLKISIILLETSRYTSNLALT